ncbi:hypothetical protein V7S52_17330, partial [Agromyces sp. CCNWLW208]
MGGNEPSPEVQRRRLVVASVLSAILIVGSFAVLIATGAGSGGSEAAVDRSPASAEPTGEPASRPSPTATATPEPVIPPFDKAARS